MTNEEIHLGLCKAAELIGGRGVAADYDGRWFVTVLDFGGKTNRIIGYDPFESDSFLLYSTGKKYSCFKQAIEEWLEFHKMKSIRYLDLEQERADRLGKDTRLSVQMEFYDWERPCVKVHIHSFDRGDWLRERCFHPDCLAAVRKYFLEPYPQGILIDVLEEYVEDFSRIYHWGE